MSGIRRVLVGIALVTAGVLALSGCFLPRIGEASAPAGDFTAFDEQELRWLDCGDGLQCTQVYAPLDWADPDVDGERITLRLVKHPAEGGDAIGTLFVNPGGPGSSGVAYITNAVESAVAEPVRQQYDVVGWDPRGVGVSSSVECLDDAAMDDYLYGLSAADEYETGSEAWLDAAAQEAAEFGAACLERTGDLLGHIDTATTVHDLDMLRALVGDEKLNYLGYSYGTYIGARYADAYPERVGRLVLDGALDPTTDETEVVREQTRGFEASLRSYVADCLGRADCPVGGAISGSDGSADTAAVDAAMAQWGVLLDAVDASPLRGSDGRWVTSGTLLTAIITPLYSQESWPWLDQLYTTASNGDADTALTLADFYNDRVDGVYESNLISAFSAINCLDYPSATELDIEQLRADAAELETIAPTIGRFQGYGEVFCANWPVRGVADRQPVSATGADPILVVGTTGDPATPFRWAESLAGQLDSGVLVTYRGEGHTAYGENDCVNAIVDDYFLTGAVPAAGAAVCG